MRADARPDEPDGLTADGGSLSLRRSKKAGRDNPDGEVYEGLSHPWVAGRRVSRASGRASTSSKGLRSRTQPREKGNARSGCLGTRTKRERCPTAGPPPRRTSCSSGHTPPSASRGELHSPELGPSDRLPVRFRSLIHPSALDRKSTRLNSSHLGI